MARRPTQQVSPQLLQPWQRGPGHLVPKHRREYGRIWSGLGVCLFALASWLAEPNDLEEAYGTKRRRRDKLEDIDDIDDETEKTGRGEKPKRPQEKPSMQVPFRERIRTVTPYKDIADQVNRNCHGKGGWRKYVSMANHVPKPGEKKPPPPTPLDLKAEALATSRCWRYAKATLQNPGSWPEPDENYPEVAFIGRSNVGKSSMLNKISQFGSVAAVSSMPGRTKHVSWYRNRKVRIDFLDMPGYGHADRAQVFGPAALEFVKNRESIKALYVLIDARHGFKRTDHEWLAELGKEGPMKQVLLTKCDMVSPKRLIKIASLARADLEAHRRVEHKLILCSSVWEAGFHDLRLDICRRCGVLKEKPQEERKPAKAVKFGARSEPYRDTDDARVRVRSDGDSGDFDDSRGRGGSRNGSSGDFGASRDRGRSGNDSFSDFGDSRDRGGSRNGSSGDFGESRDRGRSGNDSFSDFGDSRGRGGSRNGASKDFDDSRGRGRSSSRSPADFDDFDDL